MKIKPKIINMYLTAFFIIMLSGSVQTALEIKNIFYYFSMIVVFALPLYYVIKFVLNLEKYRELLLLLIFVCILFSAINCINYAQSIKMLLTRVPWLIVLVFYCYFLKNRNLNLGETIFNIVSLIAIIAVVMYFLVSILNINLPFSKVYMNNAAAINNGMYYRKYNFLYFQMASDWSFTIGGKTFPRLSACFWEPGVFAIYLDYAIYYYVYNIKNSKTWLLLILLFDLFLTVSTTGICIGIFLLMIFFISQKKYRKLVIILSVPVVLLGSFFALYIYMKKKASSSAPGMSYWLRSKDLYDGFQIFINNIIFGVGYGNNEFFLDYQGLGRGNSNGFITWIFSTGIGGIFVFLFPIILHWQRLIKSQKKKYIVYLVLILLFNFTEPIEYSAIMCLFLANEICAAFPMKSTTQKCSSYENCLHNNV